MLFEKAVAVGNVGYSHTAAGIVKGDVAGLFQLDKHMNLFSRYILTDGGSLGLAEHRVKVVRRLAYLVGNVVQRKASRNIRGDVFLYFVAKYGRGDVVLFVERALANLGYFAEKTQRRYGAGYGIAFGCVMVADYLNKLFSQSFRLVRGGEIEGEEQYVFRRIKGVCYIVRDLAVVIELDVAGIMHMDYAFFRLEHSGSDFSAEYKEASLGDSFVLTAHFNVEISVFYINYFDLRK